MKSKRLPTAVFNAEFGVAIGKFRGGEVRAADWRPASWIRVLI